MNPEIIALLQKSNNRLRTIPSHELLARAGRFARFSRGVEGLLLDHSRLHIDEESLGLLIRLARDSGVEAARGQLFDAAPVNWTERRPAFHMVLRDPGLLARLPADEAAAVTSSQKRMLAIADALHAGRLPGAPEAPVRHIVHVGIGGSLLGPRLIAEALDTGNPTAPQLYFLGSVDAHERESLLSRLDPSETAVVLVSKSFSTVDALMHGRALQAWLQRALGAGPARQRMFAVTSEPERAGTLGIVPEQTLQLPRWVGGRYSVWSAVSLSAAARIGSEAFREFQQGAACMDRHFQEADLADNLPVLSAVASVWHRNICGFGAWGVFPYDLRLRLLPAYLQQLIMESNGKSIGRDGQRLSYGTAPVVFGDCGTDAQHSVFQALHQGVEPVPISLVGIIRPAHGDEEAQYELLANLLAQATALAEGRTAEQARAQFGPQADPELLAHRTFNGDRPSEIVLLDELTPANLGQLMAMYEHRVFVESVIWGINAFDQWGVELGKSLAPGIREALHPQGPSLPGLDDLLAYIRERIKA